MILGSPHLAGWGGIKVDDMLAPKRQAQLQQLTDLLVHFQATKIAVEVDHLDTDLQTEYDAYLKGGFNLNAMKSPKLGSDWQNRWGTRRYTALIIGRGQTAIHYFQTVLIGI